MQRPFLAEASCPDQGHTFSESNLSQRSTTGELDKMGGPEIPAILEAQVADL